MSASTEAAVVIVNYNGRHLLSRFLPSVVQAAASAQVRTAVYVVDNASVDGSVEWLAAHHPDVRIVGSKTNRMWGGGNNLGAWRALADHPTVNWLIFLNNDVDVPPNFIDAMTRHGTRRDDIGITGVKTVFLYRYVDIALEHGVDLNAQAGQGTVFVEVLGIPDALRSRIITKLPTAGKGYLLDRPGFLRIPVEDFARGEISLRLSHRRDIEARLVVKIQAHTSALFKTSPFAAAFNPLPPRANTNSSVQTLLRLPYAGSVDVRVPWCGDDAVDVINNAGSWVDTVQGECGDIGISERDEGEYDSARVVDAICGVAMGVKSDVFRSLEGFDEIYSLYYEDTDFCARAAVGGVKCWYNPEATIRHLHSATSVERSAFWRRHVLRSQFIFRARHQEPEQFLGWKNHMLRFASGDPLNEGVFLDVAGLSLQSVHEAKRRKKFVGRALCR